MKNKVRIEGMSLVFAVLGGLVLIFIIAPLTNMYLNCSQEQLRDTVRDPEVQQSIWLTIWTSMAATLLFSIPAIPLAYLLARKKFPLKKLINGIINVPVVIPHSAAGIALLGVLSRRSLLGGGGRESRPELCGYHPWNNGSNGFCEHSISNQCGEGWLCSGSDSA